MITPPEYPTLFFEVGEWWDYAMLLIVTAALALTTWWAQRSKVAVALVFVIAPVLLTIFWWPYSTEGTASAGWFPIVKQYSALAGSLSLVALQYFKNCATPTGTCASRQQSSRSIFWKQPSGISSVPASTASTPPKGWSRGAAPGTI